MQNIEQNYRFVNIKTYLNQELIKFIFYTIYIRKIKNDNKIGQEVAL